MSDLNRRKLVRSHLHHQRQHPKTTSNHGLFDSDDSDQSLHGSTQSFDTYFPRQIAQTPTWLINWAGSQSSSLLFYCCTSCCSVPLVGSDKSTKLTFWLCDTSRLCCAPPFFERGGTKKVFWHPKQCTMRYILYVAIIM